MVEGEHARFWILQNLAYKGEPGSPRGMLVFDIDLIRIKLTRGFLALRTHALRANPHSFRRRSTSCAPCSTATIVSGLLTGSYTIKYE